jgi:UPF0271 protein
VLSSVARASDRAKQMVLEKSVMSVAGKLVSCEVDTLCIRGDTPNAVELARAVYNTLTSAGVELKPIQG